MYEEPPHSRHTHHSTHLLWGPRTVQGAVIVEAAILLVKLEDVQKRDIVSVSLCADVAGILSSELV
jgi:hypothetical protein